MNDLGRQQALLIALIGQDCKLKRLALLDQDTVGIFLPPARLGQQLGRMFRVIPDILDVRIVGPPARHDRPMGLLPHAKQHTMNQLVLIDGRGHGLTDTLVLEERMTQVIAHIQVTGGRIAELIEAGGELLRGRLTRILYRCQAHQVDGPGLQLHVHGGGIRDNTVDVAVDPGTPFKVARIGLQDNLLTSHPLFEDVWSGTDRFSG